MKVAILAGGSGKRLQEETALKPKALVEIGGRPILWHIMMYYAHFGMKDFAVALGYRGDSIREYIGGAGLPADWRVELLDTGVETQTGGRIKRLEPWIGGERFMLTWSDGLSNVDLHRLHGFHAAHGKLATVTAVNPPPRFGRLTLRGERVVEFAEKPTASREWINGAFFVLEPAVLNYIEGDQSRFEAEPLEQLARDGELMAYRHTGFWQCMDTVHEQRLLEDLWQRGEAPWKAWE